MTAQAVHLTPEEREARARQRRAWAISHGVSGFSEVGCTTNGHQAAGRIFWLIRNKFEGSYIFLTA